MTAESQAIVEIVDQFGLEIREEMLLFFEECAEAYLDRGIVPEEQPGKIVRFDPRRRDGGPRV